MNRETLLRRRIRWMTCVLILGLVIAGVTAIPLAEEVRCLADLTGTSLSAAPADSTGLHFWLARVETALLETQQKYPFMFYGADWLGFAHIVIALAYVGALRDPVRNRWLFDFGLIACAMVIPWAFVFGSVRGIPWWWRLTDCSLGVFGAVPLWCCRRWARELEASLNQAV
jgi:hypothetical protein